MRTRRRQGIGEASSLGAGGLNQIRTTLSDLPLRARIQPYTHTLPYKIGLQQGEMPLFCRIGRFGAIYSSIVSGVVVPLFRGCSNCFLGVTSQEVEAAQKYVGVRNFATTPPLRRHYLFKLYNSTATLTPCFLFMCCTPPIYLDGVRIICLLILFI